MNRRMELELMRLLHGELPEERARELRARMERDPALAGEYQRLQRSWEGLALPSASPVPPGFAKRTLARARAERGSAGLAGAPAWVRAAAAAALVAGTVLGIGIGGSWPLAEPSPATPEVVRVQGSGTEEDLSAIDDSLAESYWLAMEDLEAGGPGEALP